MFLLIRSKYKHNSSFIFVVLLIFSVFRYDVGWDYLPYWNEITSVNSNLLESRYEPLSRIIMYIGYRLGFIPFVFIFYSVVTLYLIYYSINKFSNNSKLSWLIYYSFPLFFFASLSTIRQSLALALILFSWRFLSSKKYFYFCLIIALAMLFHYSALIGILLLPIVYFRIEKSVLWILLIFSFFLTQSLNYLSNLTTNNEVLIRFYSQYLTVDSAKASTLHYLYYFIQLIIMINYEKLVKYDHRNKIYIKITTFGIIFYNLLSLEQVTASRLSAFFIIFWIYLIPSLVCVFKPIVNHLIKSFFVIGCIIMVYYFLFLYISAYDKGLLEKVSFLPYRSWLFN